MKEDRLVEAGVPPELAYEPSGNYSARWEDTMYYVPPLPDPPNPSKLVEPRGKPSAVGDFLLNLPGSVGETVDELNTSVYGFAEGMRRGVEGMAAEGAESGLEAYRVARDALDPDTPLHFDFAELSNWASEQKEDLVRSAISAIPAAMYGLARKGMVTPATSEAIGVSVDMGLGLEGARQGYAELMESGVTDFFEGGATVGESFVKNLYPYVKTTAQAVSLVKEWEAERNADIQYRKQMYEEAIKRDLVKKATKAREEIMMRATSQAADQQRKVSEAWRLGSPYAR